MSTTQQKKITPREGILVPMPDGNGFLPAEGKVVALNSYWYQRKADSDVTIEDVADEPDAPEVAPAAPDAASAAAPAAAKPKSSK